MYLFYPYNQKTIMQILNYCTKNENVKKTNEICIISTVYKIWNQCYVNFTRCNKNLEIKL